jgi:hypothetical protein
MIHNSSSNRGEKNPPPRKIENSHKLPVRKKMKNLIQEEEDNLIENDIQIFSLDDMELEEDIEKIFPMMEQLEIVTHWKLLQMIFLVKSNPSLFKVLFFKRNLKN